MAEKTNKQAMKASRSPDAGLKIFKDPEANWVVNRTIAFMNEKCAEFGECLYTARRIKTLGETDEDVWRDEWTALAKRVENIASEALQRGHRVSAREAYLRASNYYRTAEYCTSPFHPQFDPLWKKSVETFQKAAALLDPPIEMLHVNYQGKNLPAYFWRPDRSSNPRPTLIAAGGADSSLEELAYWVGFAAVRRGYNFFAFDHPGHRGAMHIDPSLIKMVEYEKPYRQAIDLLQTLPGVDQRLAMTGYSFGGYVTLRVAAHDERIKAIAPNPAIVHEPFAQELPGIFGKIPLEWIDALIRKGMEKKPTVKNWLKYIQWSCGYPAENWSEMLEIGKSGFTVRDLLPRISCPTLIMVGDNEGQLWNEQAQECYQGISSQDKKMHVFSIEKDGSNDHCQLDNRTRGSQVLLDWLDETFDYEMKSSRP